MPMSVQVHHAHTHTQTDELICVQFQSGWLRVYDPPRVDTAWKYTFSLPKRTPHLLSFHKICLASTHKHAPCLPPHSHVYAFPRRNHEGKWIAQVKTTVIQSYHSPDAQCLPPLARYPWIYFHFVVESMLMYLLSPSHTTHTHTRDIMKWRPY